MCDLSTRPTQLPRHLQPPEREAGLLEVASEPFQAVSHLLEPSCGHWTTTQRDLDLNPHSALHELGDLGQVPGLSELADSCLQSEGGGTIWVAAGEVGCVPDTSCAYLPSAPVRQPQGPAGGGPPLAGIGGPAHCARPGRVREHAPRQALSPHRHGVVRWPAPPQCLTSTLWPPGSRRSSRGPLGSGRRPSP